MPSQTFRSFTARNRNRGLRLAALLAAGVALSGCKPPPKPVEKAAAPVPVIDPAIVSQLADARIDAAKAKLEQQRPDEALALLVSALKADPASREARDMAATILRETVWNLPEVTLAHPMPIEQINSAAPSSLWVSLGGETNTTVRWDLAALRIENVLFPAANCRTRSLVFDSGHRSVVVERGPVTLLCNAETLKPVRDLGALPDFLTPSAAVVFSPEGLLLAHPGFVSDKDHSLVWRIRDAASGELIRSSDPLTDDAPRPLAAYLDRGKLRVIHADGSLLEMPVSPVEEIRRTPLPEPVKLLQAQFSADGNSVLVLQKPGAHEPPVQSVVSYSDEEDGSLKSDALARRFPWSRQPNIWNWLMEDPAQAPFAINGNVVKILTGPHAPVELASPVAAAAFDGKSVITGEANGILTIHRLLPLPGMITSDRKPAPPAKSSLTDLENLSVALAGIRYDEQARAFTRIPVEARLMALDVCNLDSILPLFPELDFAAVSAEFKNVRQRAAGQEAFQRLRDRLAQAEPHVKAGPDVLAIEEAFRAGDSAAIPSAIHSAGDKGPAAAAALKLALKSDHPDWIGACLTSARNLPPLLRQISLSRIDWLEGRKADALANWPEVFPELTEVRLREDWEGWEQADFKPALDDLRQCVRGELDAIQVPDSSTPEQRKTLAARLADPATVVAVGKRRFAEACLNAALAFATHKEETEVTFQLANLARNMGAAPEPCLRAEALALTALGDYVKAHPRWIELITEHPVETTLPGDYAEAAYTAFENSDPRQAMEILTTGMHRFPQDGNFALRAGWVALLTGDSERAYRFLREGQRIGFPAEKLENATALLTIAAAQTGASDDAAVYFQDLLRIDTAWADPATLDTLDWPEELKFTLSQFTR
ncbi:MAG: hypothetical protein V4819_18845 [Verrucomicrobiota bacterium]